MVGSDTADPIGPLYGAGCRKRNTLTMLSDGPSRLGIDLGL